MASDPGFVPAGSHRFALAFVTAMSHAVAAFAQAESGLPVFLGQPGVEPPRFEGRTDDTTFVQWWYVNQEAALDLRRTVTGGVDARRGFRRVLESDYERVMIALEAAQADPNPAVRAAAALALAKSQDRRGIAALLAEPAPGIPAPLFDSNLAVRRAAILGLGVGADAAALDTLRDVLLGEKWEPELRATAALAIGLIEVKVETGAPEQPEPDDRSPAYTFEPSAECRLEAASEVSRVASDAAGERALVGFADGSISWWSGKAAKLGKNWKVHAGGIGGLAFLRDDDRFASAGADGFLRVFSSKVGKVVVEIPAVGIATSVAIDPAGDWIAVGAEDGKATVIPASGKKEYVRRHELAFPIAGVAFDGAGRVLAAGRNGEIVRLGAAAKDPPETIASLGEPLTALVVDRSGERAVAGTEGGALRCLRLGAGGAAAWKSDLGARIAGLCAAAESDVVVAVTETGAIHLIDSTDGRRLATHDGGARAFAIDRTGTRLVVARGDGTLERVDGAAAPGAPKAAPGGGAPARDPALAARRMTVLSERLEPEAFRALDPLVRDGVALGAGLTGDPALAAPLEVLLDSGARSGISGPTLGYLAIAYGRLVALGGGRVERLLELATDADSADARRGAVIGLGIALRNAPGRSAESIVHALIQRRKSSSGESDRRVQNAIAMALGRIGGPRAEAFLLSEFDERKDGTSLARGPGRAGLKELDAAPLEAIALATMKSAAGYKLSRRRYEKEGAIHFRGALAVALGLHGPGAHEANKELTADLRKEKNPVLVAHLALALGLARANGAADALESRLADPKCDATILPHLSVARAMFDVPGAIATPGIVAKRLSAAKAGVERASLAFALGLIGDPSAVEPLLSLLHRKDEPSEVRAATVAALGELLDPGPFRRLPKALSDLEGVEDPRIVRTLAGD